MNIFPKKGYIPLFVDSPRMYERERRISMRLRTGQGAPNASTSDLSTSKQAK